MRTLTAILQLCVVFAALGNAASAAPLLRGNASRTQDPRLYFFTENSALAGDVILELRADIDGDGDEELFITYSDSRLYSDGYLWDIFERRDDYWRQVKDANAPQQIILRPNLCGVGFVEEVGGHALLTYARGGAGQGSFIAYMLRDGELSSHSWEVSLIDGENTKEHARLDLIWHPENRASCPHF